MSQPARRGGPAAYCPSFRSTVGSLIGNPYVLFENRSLVVFPIGHEESMAYGPQFLFEHRSWVDCQIGNEHHIMNHMVYGADCFLKFEQ